jgi:hypothetical protein
LDNDVPLHCLAENSSWKIAISGELVRKKRFLR